MPEPGTEWMLARADGWGFPDADPDCCGNSLPIEWSTSDLTASNIPVWGTQGGEIGGGVINTPPGTVFTLQTATFIPEPSAALISLISLISGAILRRKR